MNATKSPTWSLRIAACLLALAATPAMAGTISIQSDGANSTEGLGSFTGSMSYDYDSTASIGTLIVSLTNTSPASNGGFITGFLFNVAGNATAELVSYTGVTDFEDGRDQASGGDIKLKPFGFFEAGAVQQSGSGGPQDGIGVGDTGSFTFEVTGSGASGLDVNDFFSELSTSSSRGTSGIPFAVRFKGFDDGGSDKVPGTGRVVPLPAAGWMGLMLLGALGAGRRLRRLGGCRRTPAAAGGSTMPRSVGGPVSRN